MRMQSTDIHVHILTPASLQLYYFRFVDGCPYFMQVRLKLKHRMEHADMVCGG